MVRAPFQILVFPYRQTIERDWEFAVFFRTDIRCWQGISGGGEDDETPIDAARREANEETGISSRAPFHALDTTASIPVTWFSDSWRWGNARFIIPEYAFGVQVDSDELVLSAEHEMMRWLSFAAAEEILRFDSNRTALWELNQRIRGLGPRDVSA
ncbi:MAG: NUDIX hydrolase [Thermomicrobiales bacterium]